MTTPVLPGLEPVFTIEAEIDAPRSAGSGPEGERLHIPITGGRVHGPRLSGRILPGGSDWPIIAPDGASLMSAKYTIEAEDGTLILVQNDGLRVSSDAVRDRLRAGDIVDPAEHYMRSVPRFDAPDGPHRWLTRRIFVASIAPAGRRVIIDVYAVL